MSTKEKKRSTFDKVFIFIGDALLLVFTMWLFIWSLQLLGFPVEKDDFLKILPALITFISVMVAFYNVNRSQKRSQDNELTKYRREAQYKVADELIEVLVEFEEIKNSISDIIDLIHKDLKQRERKTLLIGKEIEALYEKYRTSSKKMKTVLFQREEVIFYSKERTFKISRGGFFKQWLMLDFSSYETHFKKLNNYSMLNQLIGNEEQVIETLKELKTAFEEKILLRRQEVSDLLYGDIFKNKTYEDITGSERLLDIFRLKELWRLPYVFYLFLLSILVIFLSFLGHVFLIK